MKNLNRCTVQANTLEIPGQVDTEQEQPHTLHHAPLEGVSVEAGNLLFSLRERPCHDQLNNVSETMADVKANLRYSY